jgi:hypothetical protein
LSRVPDGAPDTKTTVGRNLTLILTLGVKIYCFALLREDLAEYVSGESYISSVLSNLLKDWNGDLLSDPHNI